MKRRIFLETMGAGSLAALSDPKGSWPQSAPAQERNEMSSHMDPWIEVNLDHIGWNFSQIKQRVKVCVMAVVKANAYGHGLVDVALALEKAGADGLMVGKLTEGLALRKAGLQSPVLNFGPFGKEDCEAIVMNNLSQSVYSEEAASLHETASRFRNKASVHIDIDTGMSRTGIPYDKALPLIEKIAALSQIKIDGIATTLTEDPEFDREQLRRFREVCSAAEKKGISLGLKHAASSAGMFESPEFYLDMIRPGITLYGYYPSAQTQKEDLLKLRPALRLMAKVIFIKDLRPGDSVSYHRAFKAQKKMRVATVGIGYSDGYLPQLGGKSFVSIKGKKYPVMAAVTSNHIMVDLNNDQEIEVGDDVTLIDNQKDTSLTADVLEVQSGVSDYKILIGLNPALPRRYPTKIDIA
jgi:alanine racemase